MTRYWRLVPPTIWVLALCLLVCASATARELPNGGPPPGGGPTPDGVGPRPPGGGGGDTDADELGIYKPAGPIGSGSVATRAPAPGSGLGFAAGEVARNLNPSWIWALITWAETIRR